MNDYQIARNLGEMFENATRSLNLVFDTKNIALPPSVTSFINTNYYNVETTFTTKEIIKGLESSNENEVYTVLKHLVGKLATRRDLSEIDGGNFVSYSFDENSETVKEIVQLFPHIIKNVNSANLKIKRLVYIMLLGFNHLQQDISLLSINAIQKSLTDKSAINRSLAIRCLSGIRIAAILPILLLSMGKLVKDSSPLVRSACTIAVIKCAELDTQYNMIKGTKAKTKKDLKSKHLANTDSIVGTNSSKLQREYLVSCLKDETSTIYQLSSYLDILLSDNDPKVLSCSLVTYHELFNGCFDLLHNKINNLVSHIEDMDSFAASNLIDIMIDYSRLFFESFDKLEDAPKELKDLYGHLMNMVYYSMDYNVTFSIVKCLVTVFPFVLSSKEVRLDKIMIKLIQKDPYDSINDDPRVSISLNMILYLLNKDLVSFRSYQFSNFIPSTSDNPAIFGAKISILFKLISEENFEVIFKEMKFLVEKSDFNYFFKFKILEQFNSLILHKNLHIQQFSKMIRFFMKKLQYEKNELLVGEYITGLRQLIQFNLGYYNEILIKLVGRLMESYSDDNDVKLLHNAKASIIWLLGEFAIDFNDYQANENITILKNALPDLSLLLAKHFKDEKEFNVRLETLIFVTKLMISDIVENGKANYRIQNNKLFKIFNYVLQLGKYDIELYIRDMSRLVGSLLPNIVYYSNLSVNQEVNIDEMLNNDPVLLSHCLDKCSSVDLSVLMFQLSKPQIRLGGVDETDKEEDSVMASVAKFGQVGSGKLDAGYLSYYEDLRADGFELRDYGKYSSSLSSASYKHHGQTQYPQTPASDSRDRSLSSVSSSTSSGVGKYKLQTLDDFLGSA